MISQFKTWYRLWRGAVYAEKRSLMVGLTWTYLVLAVLGGLLGLLVKGDRLFAVCTVAGLFLFLLALTLWGTFASGAANQNRPANAKLVPTLNRKLRGTAVVAWLVTAVLAMPFGHTLGPLGPVLTVMIVSSIGFYAAGRSVDMGVSLALISVFMLSKAFPIAPLLLSNPSLLIVVLVLCACYITYSLRASFPTGGERHWRQVNTHRAFLTRQNFKSWDRQSWDGSDKHILYSWLLKQRCRSASRGDKLLLDGLGPRNNYLVVLILAALIVALAVLIKVATPFLGHVGIAMGRSGLIGVLLAQGLGAVFAWTRFSNAIRATPSEQTLLRLSPGMPASDALTRVLARRLTVICLLEWLVWTVAALTVVALYSPSPAYLQASMLVAAATLFLAGQSLENYAHKAVGLTAETVLLTGWMSGLLLAGLIWHDRQDVWLGVFGLVMATSMGAVAFRWNAMVKGPVAFPAGRMA